MLDDKLYVPEIYKIDSNEIETNESEIQSEWCPNSEDKSYLQKAWVSALTLELDSVASVDPRPPGSHCRPETKMIYNYKTYVEECCLVPGCKHKWSINATKAEPDVQLPPDSLPAYQAVHWRNNHLGVDLRPHVFDPLSKQSLLVDSGSQCTAFPPDPGDSPVPGSFLRAVNGSRINCYGKKEIEIKIGRKTYKYQD